MGVKIGAFLKKLLWFQKEKIILRLKKDMFTQNLKFNYKSASKFIHFNTLISMKNY